MSNHLKSCFNLSQERYQSSAKLRFDKEGFGCSSSAGVVWSVLPIVGNRRKAQCVSGSCLYWSQPPNCQSLPGWGGGD